MESNSSLEAAETKREKKKKKKKKEKKEVKISVQNKKCASKRARKDLFVAQRVALAE
jgi:hypothetical protein